MWDRRDFLQVSGSAALGALSVNFCMHPVGQQVPLGGTRAQPQTTRLANHLTLFLCGDVMTGRGIDQVLPHPGNPLIHERFMRSAIGYVELAERAHGPIPKPVSMAYVWGDALEELNRLSTDVRIINFETSVTTSEECQEKGLYNGNAHETLPSMDPVYALDHYPLPYRAPFDRLLVAQAHQEGLTLVTDDPKLLASSVALRW